MWEIFLKTLPFFAVIGLGYWAGRTRFFTEEATAYLTKFVFYFALSAMLFRFSATLELGSVLDWNFVSAYLAATLAVYLMATAVAIFRKLSIAEAAVEAQCAVIGNVGFLGVPMLSLLLGQEAIGPVIMVLSVDLIFFGSLIVVLITGSRDGRMRPAILKTVALGLIKNPMIVSITLGLIWSSYALPMPQPVDEFLTLLGAAATPGALFAIGASLASKSAERLSAALWLSSVKLILHPAAVAIAALLIWPVEPFAAGVMIAAAALPVAGNVYILAQHYRVAPQRVSASILISTAASVVTVAAVIAWIGTL
ncbi:AEC family transporter [Alphaproteobacteria bacterium GH1-50]|uniref:AEC family transporter n=1 Tax=Kangsaoukella pontilimi TaxID=2691042 RepID=A0A7C9MVI3_9RHOB|nr:AEC family transporter [Kangsaoukella pontilimi]MXQ06854.1 AEC family transporter [Kangsaoukella pontilimi]